MGDWFISLPHRQKGSQKCSKACKSLIYGLFLFCDAAQTTENCSKLKGKIRGSQMNN